MSAPTTMPGITEVWLATPDAADRFDPSMLDPAERDQWTGIRSARRRRDWESSRALLGAVPEPGDRRRSLSHSHGFAAIALAPATVAVGVDLEWLTPRDFIGMARVAFTGSECAYLESLDDPAELCSTFYAFWTLKEAFTKALSMPLVDALRRCCLVDASGARRADIPTSSCWRATVFAPRPTLRLAVVRVNESATPAHEHLDTVEWPMPRNDDWPVVLNLQGNSGRDSGAW
jgi:hypothetical protein